MAAALTAGCATLPDGGAVRAEPGDVPAPDSGIRFAPPGPPAGASRRAIVSGFLDAMGASPVQTSTAREFLTRQAARTWEPQRDVVLYDSVKERGRPGAITLTDAARIDPAGRWRGRLPGGEQRVDLRLEREKGEWRIATLPDALLARRSWFAGEYGQYQVYFLDPTRKTLVPEPVFAPHGDQLATTLVRSLLAGPPDPDAPWLATRLSGLRLADGAVTIADGRARVDLDGAAPSPTPEARSELAAQLAWTLRQVPGVATVQVRIADTPLTLEGGLTDLPVTGSTEFDPAVATASGELYGLADGRPVEVGAGEFRSLDASGVAVRPVRDVSVDIAGSRRAVVAADGRSVRVSALDGTSPRPAVQGEDFAHPAWDRAGHLWLLDRRSTGAGVLVVVDGHLRAVRVPGVSGHRVTDLLVSRDGTRLIAAVRIHGQDRVVESRLRWGSTLTVTPARTIARTAGLRDLGWDGPTQVVTLTSRRGVSQVRWLALDGAPDELRRALPVATVFEDVRSLVSSGASGVPVWAVTADGGLTPVAVPASRPPHGVQHPAWAG